MTDFLDLNQIDASELRNIIDEARIRKERRLSDAKGVLDIDKPLNGKMVALLFEKPSTRTRVSFEVGVKQMGGETIILSGRDMQLGHGETVADTARVLSNYVDLIMIRTFGESILNELAEYASVPVINGLTNDSHPCQIMADILTFEEHVGSVKGKTIVFLGDGNNVCNSYIHAAGQFGFNFIFCGPETLDPSAEAIKFAQSKGANVKIMRNAEEAVLGADLIVTDTWVSMHDSEDERVRRHNQLSPYQVNENLMRLAGEQARFTHCLPAHRGEEVTSEVLDGAASFAFEAAENRLHAQKAIMKWCLGEQD